MPYLTPSQVTYLDPMATQALGENIDHFLLFRVALTGLFCYCFTSIMTEWTPYLTVVPLIFMVVVDVLDMRQLAKDFAKPFVKPEKEPNLPAAREKFAKMLPPVTQKRYLIVGTGGIGERIIAILQQLRAKYYST